MGISAYFFGTESLLKSCADALGERGHRAMGVLAPGDDPSGLPRADVLFAIDASANDIGDAYRALADRVVEFHDAPLPRYPGLYPTTRALARGETTHGVTWYSPGSEPRILVQRSFDIADDETCFSLNARCFEAGLETFVELVTALEAGEAEGKTFAPVDDPPFEAARAVLDFRRPAAELARVIRALDFGPVENPIALPKVLTVDGALPVHAPRVRTLASDKAPGTVLAPGEIACGEGSLIVDGLASVKVGTVLTAFEGDVPHPAREPAWRAYLASLNPASVTSPEPLTGDRRSAPMALPAGDAIDQLTAHIAWLARINDQPTIDVMFRDAALAARARTAAGIVADVVPLRFAVDLDADVDACRHTVENALQNTMGTYARDLDLRYPALAAVAKPRVALFWETPFDASVDADLVIAVEDGVITWHHRFEAVAFEGFASQLLALAGAAFSDRKTPIRALTLLSDDERTRRDAFNDTRRDVPAHCIHQAFAAQAARTPDAVAVVSGSTRLTFAELDERSNQLARDLRKRGVGPDVAVGLAVERSAEMVIALLGILKAGGAYVPMDPTYPEERTAFMRKDSGASIVLDTAEMHAAPWQTEPTTAPEDGATPSNLAYVIYTSGSTGTPKGVLVEHRNVINFFAGMDERVGTPKPGDALLAVTSLSFDISVLELLWTLTRGMKVVLQGATRRPITFSLMYFASDEGERAADKYRLLIEGAKFGDENDFSAIWTPERHFHAFGGLYPNPSVAGAAIATITKRIGIRAGSCVLPLHHPVRVAEEWALVDNLSGGRVGIAFAAGWQPNDFILRPENYADRKGVLLREIDTVRKLWRGEPYAAEAPNGKSIEIVSLPRPVQPELPFWVTAAGNPDTFRAAGERGANVLTHLLGQTMDEVGEKIRIYRDARRKAGHTGSGEVTLMLHTFVGPNDGMVRETVRQPMKDYLKSAVGLVKLASWSFPVHKTASGGDAPAYDFDNITDEELDALLEHAFARYYETSGLFGTVEHCLEIVEQLRAIGVDDIACLLDYGVPSQTVLEHLPYLNELRQQAAVGQADRTVEDPVTHMQCTPSEMKLMSADPERHEMLAALGTIMVGGEAFPPALARELRGITPARLMNMYGPTETTIWSSTAEVPGDEDRIPLGQPIANTTLHVLDQRRQPVPVGVPGELYIGGAGVVRGYHQRPDLNEARFVPSPFASGERLYRTGDRVRFDRDGTIAFLGRVDHQVKLRGHRIELGEIEARLTEHDAVRDAVVVMREDVPGDQRLVAYCVAKDIAGVREHLGRHLPDYMVPAHFVCLDALPLTPNRKVDRKALPAPGTATRKAAFVAPTNDLEQTVAQVWKRALRLDDVGTEDNFFDLGGHSLLVVQVHRDLRKELEQPLSLTDVFRYPTIKALVAYLSQGSSGEAAKAVTEKSEGRAEARKAAAARRAAMRNRRKKGGTLSDDLPENAIAIVGYAARVPGARDVEELWDNLSQGVESLTSLSDGELEAAGVPAHVYSADNYVRSGMFMSGVENFDAGFFGFGELDASILDPQHRHFLEVAWEAMEDAAYVPRHFDGAIGVFAGVGHSLYFTQHLLLDPKLREDVGFFLLRHTGNDKDFLATRVSYLLDLDGPSVNVQTACSTSLVATHLACQSLLSAECDMALAGGVSIALPPRRGYAFREGEILSTDGHCRPFDADADGTLFGSGVGVVVLRRLEDAVAAGDRIHAVILGSAVNNDGASKVSYLAPSVDGQTACVNEALNLADVPADSISYIECHGTGTAMGDPIEVAALDAAFSPETEQKQFCAIGSIKSNIGHLDTAAGVIGLIKVALSLEHGQIPPSLHYERPNPEIAFEETPFYVNAELAQWRAEVRRAAVNSLGVGGTNAFVITEQAPTREASRAPTRADQLLVLSAKTPVALDDAADQLATHLRAHPEVNLADVAHTLQVGRDAFPFRRVVPCTRVDDAVEGLLSKERPITAEAPSKAREVVFMFGGGGAQYPNMGRELYDAEPVYREAVDRCLAILATKLDFDLKALMFPAPDAVETASVALKRPRASLASVFTTQYAQVQLWMSWGITPVALVGHSMGENTASCIAGVLSLEDALGLLVTRGTLFERVPAGGMLSVAVSPDALRELMPTELDIALVNAPEACVASGPIPALEALERRLDDEGIEYRRVAIDIAAHSSMLEPVLAPFADYLRGLRYTAPTIPMMSNVTGTWLAEEEATDPDYWLRHLRSTVRFSDNAGALLEDDSRVLLEVGPGRGLTSLAATHPNKTKAHALLTSLPSKDEPATEVQHMLTTLGRLWQNEVPVDWAQLHADDERQRISLPTYPWQHARHWVEAGRVGTVGSGDPLDERPDTSDWFYAPVWRPTRRPTDVGTGGRFLVFHRDNALNNALVSALREAADSVVVAAAANQFAQLGEGAFMVRPGHSDDLAQVFATLAGKVDHVLYLLDSGDADRVAAFDGYVALAEAMVEADLQSGIPLTAITQGAVQLAGEAISPTKAMLVGACQVLRTEFDQLRCRAVDCHEADVLTVLEEICAATDDGIVAYRGGRRFIRTHRPTELDDPLDTPRIADGGCYLITGGLGGLGLHLAEQLASRRTKLVLVSRSAPTEAKRARIAAIEADGTQVMVAQADVANREQLSGVVAAAKDAFGRIDGVFHTAGVLSEALVQLRQPADTEAVLAAKVTGTQLLDELLGDVDFWVLYSSISAFAGMPGQVDYAAANAFVDAFAHAKVAQGVDAVAINWTAWQQIGMAATLATGTPVDHPLLGRRFEKTDTRASYEVELRIDEHWVLADHRLRGGHCLMPGAGYLEMARAALCEGSAPSAVELSDVYFMVPCFVADDITQRVRISLDGDEFVIAGTDEHCRGEIRRIDGVPEASLDIDAIVARCPHRTDFEQVMRHPTLDFGPRWTCLRTLHVGEGEAVTRITLGEGDAADRDAYKLHPAMMDMATAGAQTLIRDYDPENDFFVPVGYAKLRATAELPHAVVSHIRYRENPGGGHARDVAIFDVTIADAQGRVVAQVEEFTMKRIPSIDQVFALQEKQASSAGASGPGAMLARALGLGITPGDGARAMEQILARNVAPQLVVATRSLPALLDELRTRPEAKEKGPNVDDDPELDTISSILLTHPAVAEAVVRAYATREGGRRLVAHVVFARRQRATASELRKFVRKELGEELVPQAVVDYDELPPTRGELLDPLAPVDNYVAPRTETEKTVARIWQDVLGIDRVGIYDNFFDVGGHSLLSIRAITKIAKETGVKLNQAVMVLQTLEQVAQAVAERA